MASFSVSQTESMVWIRGTERRVQREDLGYGNSGWTVEKMGRHRFCLGSDSSGVDCAKPELRQPNSGSNPNGLHRPSESDRRRHRCKNARAHPPATRDVAEIVGPAC